MRCLRFLLSLSALLTFVALNGTGAWTAASASASTALRTCAYSQLVVAAGWGPGGFAGNLGIPFVIINTGKTSCTLEGRPRLQLLTVHVNDSPRVL
jgi:hypothetical protein